MDSRTAIQGSVLASTEDSGLERKSSRGPMNLTWYRVSRHDPAKRGNDRDSWTSASDIGKDFSGVQLTSGEVSRTEQQYVTAVETFAAEVDVVSVVVSEVDFAESLPAVRDGDIVPIAEALTLVQSLFREELSCRLKATNGELSIDFGFDLYMYLGTNGEQDRAARAVQRLGLFVEKDVPSPYEWE